MPLPLLLIIIFGCLFATIICIAEDYAKTALVTFITLVISLAWTIIAATFESKVISGTSVESFTRDNSDYLIYKETLYNLNEKFGRDFEDKTKFLVEEYSPWAGGIHWMNTKIEMEPVG